MKLNNIKNKNEFDYWTELNTRWIDMDSIGHVNHVSYLSYLETARVDYFSYLGLPEIHKSINNSVILASLEVSYIRQISHPSKLNIGHRVFRVGVKSFDLLSGIFLKDKKNPICIAILKMVSFNYKTNKSIKVPREIHRNNRTMAI